MMKPKKIPRHKRRSLKAHEMLDLPVPRLEIRKYILPESRDMYNVRADYSLVYEHFDGKHIMVPLGQTMIGGRLERYDFLESPFREGAHMLNDMFVMKLRGFVVFGDEYREEFLTKGSVPNGVLAKMKKLGIEPADD